MHYCIGPSYFLAKIEDVSSTGIRISPAPGLLYCLSDYLTRAPAQPSLHKGHYPEPPSHDRLQHIHPPLLMILSLRIQERTTNLSVLPHDIHLPRLQLPAAREEGFMLCHTHIPSLKQEGQRYVSYPIGKITGRYPGGCFNLQRNTSNPCELRGYL